MVFKGGVEGLARPCKAFTRPLMVLERRLGAFQRLPNYLRRPVKAF
jgi:hypothetical protein